MDGFLDPGTTAPRAEAFFYRHVCDLNTKNLL
jgi:hypothetical protein